MPRVPQAFSYLSRIRWSTVSNALARPKKIHRENSLFSVALEVYFVCSVGASYCDDIQMISIYHAWLKTILGAEEKFCLMMKSLRCTYINLSKNFDKKRQDRDCWIIRSLLLFWIMERCWLFFCFDPRKALKHVSLANLKQMRVQIGWDCFLTWNSA